LLFNANKGAIFSYIAMRTSYIWWDDTGNVRFVQDQQIELDLYSPNPLNQQSAGRHVAAPWNIILIPRQSDFALIRYTVQLRVYPKSSKLCQFYSLLFDSTRTIIHDLPHSTMRFDDTRGCVRKMSISVIGHRY
jgi:hypothetical protein